MATDVPKNQTAQGDPEMSQAITADTRRKHSGFGGSHTFSALFVPWNTREWPGCPILLGELAFGVSASVKGKSDEK